MDKNKQHPAIRKFVVSIDLLFEKVVNIPEFCSSIKYA